MRARRAATTPSLAETLRPSEIILITSRPLCLREGPKSKSVTISLRYVKYCVIKGLSRPYFASRAACAAGVVAFSPTNGPPGTARITKKVTVTAKWTKVTVGKATITSAKAASKKITVKYKKVSGAKGYEVSYSKKKNFKKSATTTKTVKKTKYTTKKLAKGTYYVKVRAYKVDSTGNNVYGKAVTKKVVVK